MTISNVELHANRRRFLDAYPELCSLLYRIAQRVTLRGWNTGLAGFLKSAEKLKLLSPHRLWLACDDPNGSTLFSSQQPAA
jgi:hypothetical protein